jgi:hypothetical protein
MSTPTTKNDFQIISAMKNVFDVSFKSDRPEVSKRTS